MSGESVGQCDVVPASKMSAALTAMNVLIVADSESKSLRLWMSPGKNSD